MTNPYDPPTSNVERREVGSLAIRPRRSKVLVFLLFAGLALTVLLRATDIVGSMRFATWNDFQAEPESVSELLLVGVLSLGGIAATGVFIGTVVMFCMWIHRANRNARALGALAMEFTPGWSVGYWFMPILNLFRPYQAVKEVYRASDPERGQTDWKAVEVPSVFGLWWTTWILSNLIGSVTTRMSLSADPEVVGAATWAGVFELALSAPCTFAVVKIIRAIDARQAAKAARGSPPSGT